MAHTLSRGSVAKEDEFQLQQPHDANSVFGPIHSTGVDSTLYRIQSANTLHLPAKLVPSGRNLPPAAVSQDDLRPLIRRLAPVQPNLSPSKCNLLDDPNPTPLRIEKEFQERCEVRAALAKPPPSTTPRQLECQR